MLSPGFELLVDKPMTTRAQRFMAALAKFKPDDCHVTQAYRGDRKVLVLYGPGALNRQEYIQRHKQNHGRAVMWDMAYWDRQESMRMALDSLHPTKEQIYGMFPGYARKDFVLRADGDPNGHILLVGMGVKTERFLGHPRNYWASKKANELRNRYPGHRIIWRPKGPSAPLPGTTLSASDKIEEDLVGCSLVVCTHSNAAVDACVAGVPVECKGGAAQALYIHGSSPTEGERLAFLQRLAWWEWSNTEPTGIWARIKEITT